MGNKHLILLRGLPGAGKTTLAETICASGDTHMIAADDWFSRHNGGLFDGSKLGDAHAWCRKHTEQHLALDCARVVVHNTFTTRAEIEPYRQIAERTGAMLHVVTVEGDHQNTHGVPESTIDRMARRWESWTRRLGK